MGEPTLDLGISFLYILSIVLLASNGFVAFLSTAEASLGISSIYIQFIVLVLSIGLVAFFSSAEASLISVNKFRIRYLAERGNRSAHAITRVLDQHEKFFATILLTENAFIIFASSMGTVMAIAILGDRGALLLVAPLVMTVIIVTFGEITPKTLAAASAERWSLIIARPIGFIMYLETFVIYFFTILPRLIFKVMGRKQSLWSPSVSEGELRMIIDMSREEGAVEEGEAALLEKVFNFGDRQVREIMTPRPEIFWIEKDSSLESFLSSYAEHSHTRFPVFEGSIENVVGVLSVKDGMLALGKGQLQPKEGITNLLRPALFVPETKTAGSTFGEMQQGAYGLVLTVDEFGGIAGLVTLKQLLEVIVGQVGEEGAGPDEPYTAIGRDTFRLDAGMGIPEINEELKVELPEGDYQTVAGFILYSLGRIPAEGDSVEYRDLRLTGKAMSGVRTDEVELRRTPAHQGEVSA